MRYGVLRNLLESAINPIVNRLISANANPNVLTTIGTGISVAAAVAFGLGEIRTAGSTLLLGGIFDMLDGRVAREGGRASPFGAFYDSTLDRLADTALFLGIAMFFANGGLSERIMPWGVAAAILALAMALTVSYARARAEGLGFECRVGIAQRAERLLLLGVPSVLVGAGPDGMVLLAIVTILGLLSGITVVQRIAHVRNMSQGSSSPSVVTERPRRAISGAHLKGRRSG